MGKNSVKRTTKVSFLLLTGLFSLLIFSPTKAAELTGSNSNLLRNPGFEEGCRWPIYWFKKPIAGAKFIWDNRSSWQGARSISIENVAEDIVSCYQPVRIRGGKLYVIAGHVKMEGVKGYCNLTVTFRNDKGEQLETVDFLRHHSDTNESLWIYDFPHPVYVLAPPQATTADIHLLLKGAGKAWFDNIYFGSAETGSIRGTITDSSGECIEGVKVDIAGSQYTTSTNSNGEYIFESVPATSPRYLLIASRQGYQQRAKGDICVSKNTTTTVDFIMTSGEAKETELIIGCAFLTTNKYLKNPPSISPEAIVEPEFYPNSVLPFLKPHPMIDSDHPIVKKTAQKILQTLPTDERKNTRQVAYAIYSWIVKNIDHDSVYCNENFSDPTSGLNQTLMEGAWGWGHNFADWLYKPSEMLIQRRGICIEHGRLMAALLRAVGIPARCSGISHTQFWVQLSSGEGYWVATSTSKGRTAYYRLKGRLLSPEDFTAYQPAILYSFSIDERPLVHSDWYTEGKGMWQEKHPWGVTFEYTPQGFNQAIEYMQSLKEEPNGTPESRSEKRVGVSEYKYKVHCRKTVLNLTEIGAQRKIVMRFPLPIDTEYVSFMNELTYWSNHPECIVGTPWIEEEINPPAEGTFRWLNIEFDLTAILPADKLPEKQEDANIP